MEIVKVDHPSRVKSFYKDRPWALGDFHARYCVFANAESQPFSQSDMHPKQEYGPDDRALPRQTMLLGF